MKPPIVHDQKEFELWLLTEIPVYARMARMHKERGRDDALSVMVDHHLTSLLMVLGRYADRDSNALRLVAHNDRELEEMVRNGPSLMAECERVVAERREGKKKRGRP